MAPHDDQASQRRRGRGIRPWLILAKLGGLAVFLGGFAAILSVLLLVPPPGDLEGWQVLRRVVRAVFVPGVVGAVLVVLAAGLALLLQHPRVFLGLRWFRLKAALLLVLPVLHFFAHHRMDVLDAALQAGDSAAVADAWLGLRLPFALGLATGLLVAALARFKPRLGEPLGRRAPTRRA